MLPLAPWWAPSRPSCKPEGIWTRLPLQARVYHRKEPPPNRPPSPFAFLTTLDRWLSSIKRPPRLMSRSRSQIAVGARSSASFPLAREAFACLSRRDSPR